MWLRNQWHEFRLRQPHDRASQGQCPLPLRAGGRLLRLLAGPAADDVHLRLLEAGHAHASKRPSATRSTTCAARSGSGRRERGRHRLRLRRLHVPRLGAVRRPRVRREHHHRAGRVAARPDRTAAAWPTSSRCARRTSARCTPSSTKWSPSACWSTPAATSCARWSRRTPISSSPAGSGMLHFIGHVGVRDTEFYIRKHVFPGGWIPSLAQTIAPWRTAGSRSSTSRTCAGTTP